MATKNKPKIKLSGGGSAKVTKKSTSFRVGGRAGLSLPVGRNVVDLGIKGYFANSKTKRGGKTYRHTAKRLTGIDAAITVRGGNRLSAEFNTPTSKERSGMLRFNMKF